MTLRTTTRRAGAAVLLVAVGSSLAACGSSKKSTAKAPVTSVLGVNIGNAKDLSKKPLINIPDTLPPTKLEKADLVVGTGPLVKTGQQLTASYVGVSWSTNTQFDASWDRAQKTIPFTLAKGSVIDGWVQGLPGMHVGGRRLLVIPPALGYGSQGQGTTIAAGETLVFVVDAKKTGVAPTTPASTASSSSGSQLTQAQIQAALAQAQASGGASSSSSAGTP